MSIRRPICATSSTHRLGSHQEPPAARAIGLELEGRPHDAAQPPHERAAFKVPPTRHPPMTEVAMSLISSISGFRLALAKVAPPRFVEARWLRRGDRRRTVSMDRVTGSASAGRRREASITAALWNSRNIRRRGSAQRHRQHALDYSSGLRTDLRTQTERRYRCGFLVQRLLCCNPAESLSLGAAADQRRHRKRPALAHPVPLRRSKWSPADPSALPAPKPTCFVVPPTPRSRQPSN